MRKKNQFINYVAHKWIIRKITANHLLIDESINRPTSNIHIYIYSDSHIQPLPRPVDDG